MPRAAPTSAEMAELSYSALGEIFSIAVVLLAPDLSIRWHNPAAPRVLQWPEGELLGRNAADFIHVDDLENIVPVAGEMAELAEESDEPPKPSTPVELPCRILRSDGGWTPMNVTGRVLDNDGQMLAVVRPAAERHALHAVLDGLGSGVPLERMLQTLAGLIRAQFGTDHAWVVHDIDDTASVVSCDGERLSLSPAEVLAQPRALSERPEVLVSGDLWIVPVTSEDDRRVFGAMVVPESRIGGPSPWDELIAHRSANLASVAFTRDQSDRLLHQAATTDDLTGVMNRREFERALHEASKVSLPATLYFLDLNDFKEVNDELGHLAGDAVLMTVARRLQSSVRALDHVGRLGGDEFVVFCPRLAEVDVEPTRQRIADVVEQPVSLEGLSVSVSASVGVARAFNSEQVMTLITRADSDMFERKRARGSGRPAVPVAVRRASHLR